MTFPKCLKRHDLESTNRNVNTSFLMIPIKFIEIENCRNNKTILELIFEKKIIIKNGQIIIKVVEDAAISTGPETSKIVQF